MHFKQIGILIGGGGLLIFAAIMGQSYTDNVHEAGESNPVAAALPSTDIVANLTLPTPQGFQSEHSPAGVTYVETGDVRSPMIVRINLQADAGIADATQERALADGLARYKIAELEGGSGGALWQLDAVRDTPKGALVMQASKQAELGPPDFSEAWIIFESVSIKD